MKTDKAMNMSIAFGLQRLSTIPPGKAGPEKLQKVLPLLPSGKEPPGAEAAPGQERSLSLSLSLSLKSWCAGPRRVPWPGLVTPGRWAPGPVEARAAVREWREWRRPAQDSRPEQKPLRSASPKSGS